MATIETTTALFLDEDGSVTATQLVEQTGLTLHEVELLVECGAIAPRDFAASMWTFSARSVLTARSARRLRDEFALDDAHAVAILLRFLQRIEALEGEVRHLRRRF
ncbi:MAG TPA: chaperone modulator CbpM [Casimicrobiaceae bacterium]|nr:chaperone modulator CbpM [Casimicrobiaceae bacterium]